MAIYLICMALMMVVIGIIMLYVLKTLYKIRDLLMRISFFYKPDGFYDANMDNVKRFTFGFRRTKRPTDRAKQWITDREMASRRNMEVH